MRMTEEEYQKLLSRRGVSQTERKAITDEMRSLIDTANSKAKNPPEDQEQLALVNWLRMKGIRFHHSPNGGHRHKAVASKMKAQGVSAGFPDLIIFPAINSNLPVLFVEMKRQRVGTVSEHQKEWLDYLNRAGFPAQVCKGFHDARRFIEGKGY